MVMISFRPDERTEQELQELAAGRDRSTVLREIIHEAYIERQYAQAREDAERLRHDEADKAELARIAEEMGDSDAW
jgi:predicted DNA-binding protein